MHMANNDLPSLARKREYLPIRRESQVANSEIRERCDARPIASPPQPHRGVPISRGRRHDVPPARREKCRRNRCLVRLEVEYLRAGVRVPDPHRPVLHPRQYQPPIRRERHLVRPARRPENELSSWLILDGIYFDRAVPGPGGKACTFSVKGNELIWVRTRQVLVRRNKFLQRARLGVPDAVLGTGRGTEPASVPGECDSDLLLSPFPPQGLCGVKDVKPPECTCVPSPHDTGFVSRRKQCAIGGPCATENSCGMPLEHHTFSRVLVKIPNRHF